MFQDKITPRQPLYIIGETYCLDPEVRDTCSPGRVHLPLDAFLGAHQRGRGHPHRQNHTSNCATY